jgi:hypothetical protein
MAEADHFLVRCKRCTTIVTQCKCPSPTKTERWMDSCRQCLEIDHGQEKEEARHRRAGR